MSLVSVVVPTRNRASSLEHLLDALRRQTYPQLEIVVLDDASSDRTPQLLERWQGSGHRALRQTRSMGSYAARNRAWREASGDLIAFTDDDCIPQPDWVAELVKGLDGPATVGVQGRTLPEPGEITPFTHQIEQTHGGPPYRTCNILYRRAELERQGGFDDTLRWYADNIFGLRARQAGPIAFSPAAVVLHPPRPRDWRSRDAWLQRFRADTVHRRELQRLGVEPAMVPGKGLPLVLWVARPLVKQSFVHLRYALRHPVLYRCGIVPMIREKRDMLLAMREYWREGESEAEAPSVAPLPPLGENSSATVVIVTRNRPRSLERTLAALAQQTWQFRDVIVVDNGEGEAADVTARAKAEYVQARGMGLGAARQLGIEAAIGNVIAFTDDDCLPTPDWLACLVQAFVNHPTWYGVQGRTCPENGPIDSHAISVQSWNSLFHTCNIAYRRRALEMCGGFDTEFTGWFEDTALGARVLPCGPIGWEPRAIVIHRAMPRRHLDRAAWLRLLQDERRLALIYPDFYRQYRGPSFAVTVIARWLIGSPAKTLLQTLPRAQEDPKGYWRLARNLLVERVALLEALLDSNR